MFIIMIIIIIMIIKTQTSCNMESMSWIDSDWLLDVIQNVRMKMSIISYEMLCFENLRSFSFQTERFAGGVLFLRKQINSLQSDFSPAGEVQLRELTFLPLAQTFPQIQIQNNWKYKIKNSCGLTLFLK